MAQMREDQLAQRSISGFLTPSSTPLPTPHVSVLLWTTALLLLLILLAWTALAQLSSQESSKWSLCGQTPSLQSGGLSTSKGLAPYFKSAESSTSKSNP